ncbi:MAG: nickel insertion protein [Peptostreptococcaceae bacterium]|nr:nickel insertion protein [Peptostreptococcaceae bacterium]
MSSEIYSYLYEKVLEEGALDIYTESIYMKKNRPATKVCILCQESDLDKFIEILLTETSTFGVRYNIYNREELKRKFEIIDTKYGKIKVKLGYHNNKLIKATPEYDECKIIAKNYNISLNEVFFEINCIIKQKINTKLLT